MSPRHQRQMRRAAVLFIAGVLAAASGTAAAVPIDSTNPILRNDFGHYGGTPPSPLTLSTATPRSDSREPIVVRVDGGFDWVSAGVGAAALLGLVFALGGAASAIRRHRIDEAVMSEEPLAKGL